MRKINSLLIAGALTLIPVLAPAANLTWDANSAVTGAQDGSGTWDTTTSAWWTGSANAAFNNATPDVPTFGAASGTAGTITLGANIVSGSITFNAPSVGNYTIAGGGNNLSLTNRTITANVNATISANIVPIGSANSSLTLANSVANAPSAVLTLSGNNSFTNFSLGPNAANTTAAVRIGSSTAFGWGNIGVAGGQGSQTSHRIELVGNSLTITNSIANLGRNNHSAVVVNLGSGNTLAGTQTKTTGGQDTHWASEVANGLTFSGASGNGIAFASGASSPRYFVLRGTGGGTISGVISNNNGSSLGIVKAGSGTWTLSGQNYYTNQTIVDEGTLTLDYNTQNNSKLADVFPLVLGGGNLNLTNGSHTEVVGSTTLGAGNSSVTRSSGTATLRMNTITRNRGGVINFGAAGIADTDSANINGLLGGGYATIAGADWAINSTGAGDGAITAYSSYTDIAATGSTITDGAGTNVRLNSAGGGGNIALGAATTTVNSLLQNTATAATIDTSAGTLRLGAVGGVLLPSGKEGVTIGTAADSGTLTAGGADNTAGELVLINNSGNSLLVNSITADNGTGPVSLTKAGSGSVTLGGNNTHTGTNSIVGGTLNISSDANLGTVPGAVITNILINGGTLNATADISLSANRTISLGPTSRFGNGTIGVDSSKTLTIPGVIANSDATGNSPGGSLTKTGNGTLVLSGANTYTAGTFLNSGTVSITASGNLGAQPGCYIPDHLVLNGGTLEAAGTLTLGSQRGIMLGPIGGSGSGTFQVDDGVTLQLDSRIADNWNGTGSLIKTGNGTLTLTSGFNDYSGNTTVSAGVLQINNSRAIPNGAGRGNVTVNGTLNLNGVNFHLNGLSGSGTVDNITGTGMTLGVGNNDQTSSFGGIIQNSGGGPLALSKAGSGTITLTGAANHTGSTLVTAGAVALTGSATIGSTTNIAVGSGATLDVSGLTSGTLTLNSGQTLSGNGTVLGTINTGLGVWAPGTSAGTLTVANLTLGSGSSLNYELANVTTVGSGVNDYTIVTGTLTVAGPLTLNLSYLNAIPAATGKYTLFSYNIFSGNVADISVPTGFTITNNASAKTIELLIDHNPVSLTWRGDGSANYWDINGTANWGPIGSPQFFFNGDTANFDDTGSNTPPIYVSAPVIAAAVNVNAAQSYNFTGSSISAATLSKSGSGTLTLENDNTYASGTIINHGTLQIGNAAASGTLTGGNLTNNATLVFNSTSDLVIASAISGSGAVTQIGTASVGLNASNSYAGLTLISSGRIYPRSPTAFGDTNNGTTVSSGAQIYVDQNINFAAEPLTLNGSGFNSTGDGALRKGGAGVTTFAGPITLGSDTTINLDGNATLNLTNAAGITGSSANLTLTGGAGSAGLVSGPILLGSGGGILTKTGSASWTLGGSNSMSLATIDNGTLVLAHTNALGTNLNVVLTSTTGGVGLSGTRLTLSGGISIPANRSLSMPSGGAGGIRSVLFGTGAGSTNTWGGSVTLFGDGGTGNLLAFGADNNSTFVISGNVTADASFPGKLLIRGNGGGSGGTGLGILSGTMALDPANGQVQVDDGSTWILGSSANTWLTTVFAGSSTIRLGANNALPTASVLTLGNGAANRLDLAGFNQQIAGMDAAGINITNSSSGADSTLTLSSAGASTFGGALSEGARQLNLTIAAGTLILTNPPTLKLTHSTVSIASGAVLQLDYTGTNQVVGLVTNGVSAGAGLYGSAEAAPYLAGTGYLLVQPGPGGPAPLSSSVSGNTLSLSWPAGQGWRLQAQTNGLSTGLSNNWIYVTDGSPSSTNITINPLNPTVFYRLRYP